MPRSRPGPKRVLHTSTESILTCARRTGPIAEDVEVDLSDARRGPIAGSKLRAENEAMDRARAGRPVVVANPTMPVGPGDRGTSPPTRLIRDFCRGELPARMDCTLNLIDVRDVAEGLIRTMERGPPRASVSARRRELDPGRPARHPVGVDRSPRPSLARPVRGRAGRRPRQRAVVRPRDRTDPQGDRHRRPPDPEEPCTSTPRGALRNSAWSPRPIRGSLADAVAWLRQVGAIPDSGRPGRHVALGREPTPSR